MQALDAAAISGKSAGDAAAPLCLTLGIGLGGSDSSEDDLNGRGGRPGCAIAGLPRGSAIRPELRQQKDGCGCAHVLSREQNDADEPKHKHEVRRPREETERFGKYEEHRGMLAAEATGPGLVKVRATYRHRPGNLAPAPR